MPQKMSGSFGSGASSQIATPGRSARLRGSAMTPKPAATAAPSPARLEPMNTSSLSRPTELSAATMLRVNGQSSP